MLDHVASTQARERPQPRDSRAAAPAPLTERRASPPAPGRVLSRPSTAPSPERRQLAERRRLEDRIRWRPSFPAGTPNAGALQDAVGLPHEGVNFFTLDPVTWTSPTVARGASAATG